MAVCEGFEVIADPSIADMLAVPAHCWPYFWAAIFLGIWVIVSVGIYRREKETYAKTDVMSAMGVAALVMIIVGGISTLNKMMDSTVFLQYLIFLLIFVVIWLFKD